MSRSQVIGKALICVAALGGLSAIFGQTEDEKIRAAAGRSIALLQKVMGEWKPGCNSCHHQYLPTMALAVSRHHGLAVDETGARRAAAKSYALYSNIDLAAQDYAVIDPAISEGYGLLAAHAAGIEPSLTTRLYARRIAAQQRDDGHWATLDGRPPQSDSLVTATAIAVRAISLYDPSQKAVLEKAKQWLLTVRPVNAEDRAYQLLGLFWSGVPVDERMRAAEAILAVQQTDGGWAQEFGMTSDAYATGLSLSALAEAGETAGSPRFRRGIAFLLTTQKPDGSWRVATRIHTPAPVSPPYGETGFPYGKDQFISCAATAWSVMALAHGLPVAAEPKRPLPVTEATVKGEKPWMQIAAFGTVEELRATLAGGLDPNSKTDGGTTLLMMAVHDSAKVKVLLEAKADPLVRAKNGYDALLVAALERGSSPVLRMLLERGASPKPRPGVIYGGNALVRAAVAGDAEAVKLLLANGADAKRKMALAGTAPLTSLATATNFEDADVIRALVAGGVPVDEIDGDKMTSLSWTALGHKNTATATLLELGANPVHRDRFSLTPLEHTKAIQFTSPETEKMIRMALEKKN